MLAVKLYFVFDNDLATVLALSRECRPKGFGRTVVERLDQASSKLKCAHLS
jgi:hypothetical protein